MSRSLKKGPYVEESLLRKVEKMQASGKKQPIKTWSRRSMVLPDFVGLTFAIHNGSTCRSSSRKTWSATVSANSPRRVRSRRTATPPPRPRSKGIDNGSYCHYP